MDSSAMRACIVGVSNLAIETKTIGSSQVHQATGEAAGKLQILVDILDTAFGNVTYDVVGKTSECLEKQMTNQSDFSNNWASMASSVLPVPIAFHANRPAFLSGYNMSEEKHKSVDALNNFSLISSEVYIISLVILILTATLVAIRIVMDRYHRTAVASMLGVSKLRILGKKFTSHRMSLSSAVSCHLFMIIYGTSNHFKLITLIFAAVVFFNMNAFLAVYSTSQVVQEEPETVKSYTELIVHPNSEPMFYDGLVPQSGKFKAAPKDTLKGAIWKKFKQLKRNHLWRELDDVSKFAEAVQTAAAEIITNKSVLFVSSTGVNLLQEFYCCLSPEHVFWRILVHIDQSEHEELTGIPVSPHMKGEKMKKFLKQTRRIVEAGLIQKFDAEVQSVRQMAALISGAGEKHMKKQVHLCSDDYVRESVQSESDPIPLDFYKSLAMLCLYLLALAFLSFMFEILFSLVKGRRSRPCRHRIY